METIKNLWAKGKWYIIVGAACFVLGIVIAGAALTSRADTVKHDLDRAKLELVRAGQTLDTATERVTDLERSIGDAYATAADTIRTTAGITDANKRAIKLVEGIRTIVASLERSYKVGAKK